MGTITLLGLIALIFAQPARAEDNFADCPLETLGIFLSAAVVDGRTLRIEDGRDVRLAAIEVAPGESAKAALERLVAGKQLTLKQLESATDRYGHLVAHVFVIRDGAEFWAERDMIAAGHARVGARVGHRGCATALLKAEAAARKDKRGLWADPDYDVIPADDAAGLLARRGQFALAEGKVLSVREAGGTIYVNFGRVWSRNLTVTILKRHERAFAAAGLEPKRLEGRRIRVRGWIEEFAGPRVEAVQPEQIEIVD